ncbi:MAG: homocysteine biosynthesis protein, partial [Methanomassiliicoccaceae archaeon]|nr:homocysteine biosynthesis protein [Methanomassiliicoccaceae archaeon]
MKRTYAEINEKIRKRKAVVLTAEEVIDLVKDKGVEGAAKEADVVTTGTFGAMCSSGAFINLGHSDPPIRMTDITLNGVRAYGGVAAVDAYIGATQMTDKKGGGYGGGHVIEDLVAGKKIHLVASGPGTDCYTRKSIETTISLDTVNEAYMYNPRNAYQNYVVATNSSDRTLQTYMGKLLPNYKNATYSSAGQLSPLLNDPHLETIGVGTRIFLGGGEGYVSWAGTQFNTHVAEVNGVPTGGSRTLAVIGNLRGMDREYVRGLDIHGYGTSLAVGVGVPIPILNENVMKSCSVTDDDLFAKVTDYGVCSRSRPVLGSVSYAQLKSGKIECNGRTMRTSPLSSYKYARKVAGELKEWIETEKFELTVPSAPLPEDGSLKVLR